MEKLNINGKDMLVKNIKLFPFKVHKNIENIKKCSEPVKQNIEFLFMDVIKNEIEKCINKFNIKVKNIYKTEDNKYFYGE